MWKSIVRGVGLAALAAGAGALSQAATAGHVGKETLSVAGAAIVTAILAYLTKSPSQQ